MSEYINADIWSCVKEFLVVDEFKYATLLKSRMLELFHRLFTETSVIETLDTLNKISDTVVHQIWMYIKVYDELMDTDMHTAWSLFSDGKRSCEDVLKACKLSKSFSPNDTLELNIVKAKTLIEENRVKGTAFNDPFNPIRQLSYDYPLYTNDYDEEDIEEED